MGKLSSAIVQRKLAPLRDVEEALAHQVLYGGDLATNLLEQTPKLDERELSLLLSETIGLPAAPHGELPRASADTLKLLPGDVALRHGVYPLKMKDGTLSVVVSEPLKPEVEQDLGFGLGVRIEQRVAPLVRIRQAIGRDYGVTLDRRTQRVLAKLEGRPDPSPSLMPSPFATAQDIGSLPRPPSIPPFGLPTPMDMSPLYGDPAPVALGTVLYPEPAKLRVSEPPVARPATEPPPADDAPAASPADQLLPAPAESAAELLLPAATRGLGASFGSPTIGEVTPEPDVSIHDRVTAPPPPVGPSDVTEGAPDGAPPASEVSPPPETPRVAEPPPSALRTPRPEPAPPPLAAFREDPAPPRSTRSSGQHALALGAWSAETKQSARKGARSKHRGPYTAAAAERDLFAAEERDVILTAFFDFVSQYFEYSALFVVHGDLAEGRDAHGPGADRAAVLGIGVPLDLPSSLATVRREGRFSVAAPEGGLDARLVADLGRPRGKKVLLLPVQVRGRAVVILYGDEGKDDVDLSLCGDVIAFAPLVATALESLILRKKTAVRQAAAEAETRKAPSVYPAPPSRKPQLPTREERAENLAQALQNTLRAGESASLRPSTKPPPPRTPAASERAPSTRPALPEALELPKRPSTKPAIPAIRPRSTKPVDPTRSPTPAQGTPRQAAFAPADASPIPLNRRLTPGEPAAVPPDDEWKAQAPPLSARSAPRPPVDDSDGPEISIGVAEVDDLSPDIEDLGPSSMQVVVAPRLPLKRYSSAELRLPSVIVNIENDFDALVGRLASGDESVLERITGGGAAAASVLVSRLPGPTKPGSDRLESPTPASQRGPLLRALVKIGQPAVPFLAVRGNDADPQIRGWATQLLGELPSGEAAQAIARRVSDANAEVRRFALEAGRHLQADEEARTTLRDRVAASAEDAGQPMEARVAAIEALAHWRDPRAVPRLTRLVTQTNEAGQSAQWALGVIARQTFGKDAGAWEAWWKDHADQHRIEWLIDALMHDDSEIRRSSGEELKALTKEYFGYYDDLPKAERLKAQRRYREWWGATGKARFSGG